MKCFLILLLAVLSGCVSMGAIDPQQAGRVVALAQTGNAEAQYHTGMFYNNGVGGMPRDPRRAFEWFRQSAAGGDPLGAYKLGCYYAGQFPGAVELDDAQALAMKLVAAKAGYSLAQHDVGGIYYGRKEYAEAARWLTLAADQGFAQSNYALYLMHEKGLAGPKNASMAYARYKLANRNPLNILSASAQTSLGYLAEKLTPQELAAADEFVASFVAKPTKLTKAAQRARQSVESLLASQDAKPSARMD